MNSIEEQRNLSDKELVIFNAEIQRQSRSSGLAYVLWFFFGGIGVHKFYMGRFLWGLIYLLLLGFGIIFVFSGIVVAVGSPEHSGESAGPAAFGILALCALGLLLLWDLFTISRQLRRREEKIKKKLLAQLNTAK